MEAQIQVFQHEMFGSLRTLRKEQQGEPWFVAKDVCGCLGLDTSNLSKMLDEDELSTCPVQYTDQVRNLSVVSEPGLYSLVLRSRKPEAKAFKRWVTHDILPSIRKSGGYMATKPDDTPETILARAVLIAQDTLKRVEAERDEAVRTKAWIGSRREASAMATAASAARRGDLRPDQRRHLLADRQVPQTTLVDRELHGEDRPRQPARVRGPVP